MTSACHGCLLNFLSHMPGPTNLQQCIAIACRLLHNTYCSFLRGGFKTRHQRHVRRRDMTPRVNRAAATQTMTSLDLASRSATSAPVPSPCAQLANTHTILDNTRNHCLSRGPRPMSGLYRRIRPTGHGHDGDGPKPNSHASVRADTAHARSAAERTAPCTCHKAALDVRRPYRWLRPMWGMSGA
jgi:hypothetical protein